MDKTPKQLELEASGFRAIREWESARKCYEVILGHDELSPLDRAKTLANVMQMYEEEKDIVRAVYAGVMAYKIVQKHRLYRGTEGAHLRGYVRGSLNRLREQYLGTPWLDNADVVAVLFHVTNPVVEFVHTVFGSNI